MHVFLVDNEHFRFPGGREESGARSAPSRSPMGDTSFPRARNSDVYDGSNVSP